jgi:hypothetical protein
MSHDASPVQQLIDAAMHTKYLARGITDTARGTRGNMASDAHMTMWFIEDVRSLTQQMINIISNDAHTQP